MENTCDCLKNNVDDSTRLRVDWDPSSRSIGDGYPQQLAANAPHLSLIRQT
jgi:hypothetical protein